MGFVKSLGHDDQRFVVALEIVKKLFRGGNRGHRIAAAVHQKHGVGELGSIARGAPRACKERLVHAGRHAMMDKMQVRQRLEKIQIAG